MTKRKSLEGDGSAPGEAISTERVTADQHDGAPSSPLSSFSTSPRSDPLILAPPEPTIQRSSCESASTTAVTGESTASSIVPQPPSFSALSRTLRSRPLRTSITPPKPAATASDSKEEGSSLPHGPMEPESASFGYERIHPAEPQRNPLDQRREMDHAQGPSRKKSRASSEGIDTVASADSSDVRSTPPKSTNARRASVNATKGNPSGTSTTKIRRVVSGIRTSMQQDGPGRGRKKSVSFKLDEKDHDDPMTVNEDHGGAVAGTSTKMDSTTDAQADTTAAMDRPNEMYMKDMSNDEQMYYQKRAPVGGGTLASCEPGRMGQHEQAVPASASRIERDMNKQKGVGWIDMQGLNRAAEDLPPPGVSLVAGSEGQEVEQSREKLPGDAKSSAAIAGHQHNTHYATLSKTKDSLRVPASSRRPSKGSRRGVAGGTNDTMVPGSNGMQDLRDLATGTSSESVSTGSSRGMQDMHDMAHAAEQIQAARPYPQNNVRYLPPMALVNDNGPLPTPSMVQPSLLYQSFSLPVLNQLQSAHNSMLESASSARSSQQETTYGQTARLPPPPDLRALPSNTSFLRTMPPGGFGRDETTSPILNSTATRSFSGLPPIDTGSWNGYWTFPGGPSNQHAQLSGSYPGSFGFANSQDPSNGMASSSNLDFDGRAGDAASFPSRQEDQERTPTAGPLESQYHQNFTQRVDLPEAGASYFPASNVNRLMSQNVIPAGYTTAEMQGLLPIGMTHGMAHPSQPEEVQFPAENGSIADEYNRNPLPAQKFELYPLRAVTHPGSGYNQQDALSLPYYMPSTPPNMLYATMPGPNFAPKTGLSPEIPYINAFSAFDLLGSATSQRSFSSDLLLSGTPYSGTPHLSYNHPRTGSSMGQHSTSKLHDAGHSTQAYNTLTQSMSGTKASALNRDVSAAHVRGNDSRSYVSHDRSNGAQGMGGMVASTSKDSMTTLVSHGNLAALAEAAATKSSIGVNSVRPHTSLLDMYDARLDKLEETQKEQGLLLKSIIGRLGNPDLQAAL